jgi:hypothetical protein
MSKVKYGQEDFHGRCCSTFSHDSHHRCYYVWRMVERLQTQAKDAAERKELACESVLSDSKNAVTTFPASLGWHHRSEKYAAAVLTRLPQSDK